MIAKRIVAWRLENCEKPGNEHFVDDYEIVAPSVVLVAVRDGKQTEFKNLDEVWSLVHDEEAFVEHVQKEIRALLPKP
jgi:hypothetical protein